MMNKRYKFNSFFVPSLLLLLFFGASWQELQAQATIQVRVLWVRANNNVSCDGFFSGDSDFVWEFFAEDNTIGRSNNNPSGFFGLFGDFNHAWVNNNNGPYCHGFQNTAGSVCASGTVIQGGGGFNPNNGIFFNHNYVCPGDVPSEINFDWEGYENNSPLNYRTLGLFEGETGIQSFSFPIPATPGSSGPIIRQAASIDAGCPQNYYIAFEIIRQPLTVTPLEDNICDAFAVPVDGVTRDFTWCPNATLEPGEPRRGKVANHGSRWFYFTAPASGRVDISTDHGVTDFGTYFEIYHAADGAGCNAGLQPVTGALIKDKFKYLSYVDFADLGGFLNTSGQADITFNNCGGLFSQNALVAGEVYYVQMTTDNANERGFIGVSITNLGGSPAEPYDIPCRAAPSAAITTAVRTFGAGSPESADLPFDCSTGRELGNFNTGTNPVNFQAYEYNHPATNNTNIDESVWMSFTAPNSGRIYMEGNVRGLFGVNETENLAFFGLDQRFAPGRPTDYSCADLSVIDAANGGTGILGAPPTAIIEQSCIEPGYTYWTMIDPPNISTGSDAKIWAYDPSGQDPSNNPPGNDILCLALTNPLYQVPVIPVNTTPPFTSVAGTNIRACREYLAGEPASNADPTQRADQTVWHYFVVPPSGVVDIRLRSYTGMQGINYGIYRLLNGATCYGGLAPATYTEDGTQTAPVIVPIVQGQAGFTGTTESLCCLTPGDVYAVQIDGIAPNDEGQYIIEIIEEIEVYAGDSRYTTQAGDTINHNSNDTAYICYGDSIFPSIMLDPLGNISARIPGCLDTGFVLHNTFPIPDTVANVGFVYIDSSRLDSPRAFVNNGNGSGAFGNPLFNSVYYVSALADETNTWGDLTCPSASMENGAPVVFLRAIQTAQSYNSTNCVITFSADGGLPAYDGSDFSYVVVSAAGDTIASGTTGNAQNVVVGIPVATTYEIYISDGVGCAEVISVNATPCLDPCINNPVVLAPNPVISTVYTCLPGGQEAEVRIQLNGGAPTLNGSLYTVDVRGSSVAGENGVRTQVPVGGANPTEFLFRVADNDSWQILVTDENGCIDSLDAVFTYNQVNCPNYCQINPLVSTSTYNCLPNFTALVELTLGGGQPAILGTDYIVSVSGSTVFGQTFNNAQIPGQIGGTTGLSFLVNDGDTWEVIIEDSICSDTLRGTFVFNASNCSNFCQIIPAQASNPSYLCIPGGTAELTITLAGGAPSFDGSDYTVEVLGSSAGGNTTGTAVAGLINGTVDYTFLVGDGDNWEFIITDNQGCTDTLRGLFEVNTVNCPNICALAPVELFVSTYRCNLDGTAELDLLITGGAPFFDGSDYLVTINGSGAGGNSFQLPVPGVVSDTARYTFAVADGDTWQVIVVDNNNCNDDIQGTFVWNATNCGNLCDDPAYLPLSINSGAAILYDCDGDGNAIVNLQFSGGLPALTAGAYPYGASISINGSSSVDTISPVGSLATTLLPLANGDEWGVLLFDDLGCDTFTISNSIFTAVNAVAQTDASRAILVGQFATLDGTASTGNITSYRWAPTDRVDDPTQVFTRVQGVRTTVYTLEVSDDFGCIDRDSVEVPVGPCIPEHVGFTPNGDGTNDLWDIPCLELFTGNVEIYNRWGQLVYQMDNYDGTWDGRAMGSNQHLPDATYYYVVTVTFPDQAKPVLYKGTVTIIR